MGFGRKGVWRVSVVCCGLAGVGAAVLFVPALEFGALDVVERMGLPIGVVGNFAMYVEGGLIVVAVVGFLGLAVGYVVRGR